MGGTTLVAICLAAAAVLAVVVLGALLLRERRHTAALLAAGHTESADLRRRVEELSLQLDAGRTITPTTAEFLITDAGTSTAQALRQAQGPGTVPDRVVVSAALGEPLVRVAALGHGLRRALDPRTRNRIWFEMKQQVRTARKQRRRDVRAHLRADRVARRQDESAA